MLKIIVLLILLPFVSHFIYANEDLPDVEIIGPSDIRSILEKRGLPYPDLLLSDVVDSLQPILPSAPIMTDKLIPEKKNYLHIEMNNQLDLKAVLMSERLLATPLSFKAYINSATYDENWSTLGAEAGVQNSGSGFYLDIFAKTINTGSSYDYNNQSVNAIEFNYYINNVSLLNRNLRLQLSAEIQNSQHHYVNEDKQNKLSFYNGLGFSTYLSDNVSLAGRGFLAYNTPLASIDLGFSHEGEPVITDFFKGISLNFTDKMIVPGLHLSKRMLIDNENILHLSQNSVYTIYDNYRLLVTQPWQKQQSDALIAFHPLNAHIVWSNQSIFFRETNLQLYVDLGVQFKVDEPVYTSADNGNELPYLLPENVLQNNLKFSAVHKSDAVTFTQSILVDKGWRVEKDNAPLPYLPLFTLDTNFSFKKNFFGFSAWLKQYYRSRDDLDNFLRESIDIGAQADFALSENILLYVKLTNLLEKGKIVFRNLPTEPQSIAAGFNLRF